MSRPRERSSLATMANLTPGGSLTRTHRIGSRHCEGKVYAITRPRSPHERKRRPASAAVTGPRVAARYTLLPFPPFCA